MSDQEHYDQLLAKVLRVGSWLTGPQAMCLAPEEWERQFNAYQEDLAEVIRLGDEMRPTSLRERPVACSAFIGEVSELFSA